MSEWVDVSERLPDQGDWYLVVAPSEGAGMLATMAFFEVNDSGDAFWLTHNDAKGSSEWEGVTHWQPLPEPPK